MAPLGRFFVFCILFSGFICHCAAEGVNLTTLRQVQVVYRHGARAPYAGYPTDPYKDVSLYWPEGPGQLTEVGKDQQYDLGQFLRNRYNGFIDTEYKMNEFHILSSDVDRTLMSAEANLAGFYPRRVLLQQSEGAAGSQRQRSKLDLQLVPIHVEPKRTDKTLQLTASCPRADIAVEEYKSRSGLFERLSKENKEFLQFLSKNAGIQRTDVTVVMSVKDPLYAELAHNFTLPSWVNATVIQRIRELEGNILLAENGGTTEIKRLKGGPLAKKMLQNMGAIQGGSTKAYKFNMYSAHDFTLTAVMSTMGVFDPISPWFASTFILELHQDEGGRYFVNLYYRNSTTVPPYELHVPRCGTPCYLEELTELLEPVIPDNWEQECFKFYKNRLSLESAPAGVNSSNMAIIAFLGIMAAAIIMWLSITVVKYKRERRLLYRETQPILKGSLYSEIA